MRVGGGPRGESFGGGSDSRINRAGAGETDFGLLGAEGVPRVFVGATHVRSGRATIFSGRALALEAVLASACLPQLFPPVGIDGELYWDGGYSANPPLSPFLHGARGGDVLLVQINPVLQAKPPRTPQAIAPRASALPRSNANQPMRERPVDAACFASIGSSAFSTRRPSAASDFATRGCTLYNTFDPCGMCAVTLLACYMKRIIYLFEDAKFSAVYDYMRQYFKGRDSAKEPVTLGNQSELIGLTKSLLARLRQRVHELEHQATPVPLVMTLDYCRDELGAALQLLLAAQSSDLVTTGNEKACNERTLIGVQQFCNIN